MGSDRDADKVARLLHQINNMLCSIRFHAAYLISQPDITGIGADMVEACHEIDARVGELAVLARKATGLDPRASA